ncbi:hypothetical protein PILCRDRAFT_648064 [Piloderma croceum F 1598]|uniref:Uncharacterized protein n=1 Tax=Piloderma croceum (strain F 1598) TaxID=765440 RepID=A0A0C3BGA0_PILCF|nr:hypothetical protein PILCRDRAFT_648064 [Piloderma croceum F 1598]
METNPQHPELRCFTVNLWFLYVSPCEIAREGISAASQVMRHRTHQMNSKMDRAVICVRDNGVVVKRQGDSRIRQRQGWFGNTLTDNRGLESASASACRV